MYTSFYEIDSHQSVLKAITLMETRYKLIANNIVFLIFALVGTTNCASLNLTDANVCPRRVTVGYVKHVLMKNYFVTKEMIKNTKGTHNLTSQKGTDE